MKSRTSFSIPAIILVLLPALCLAAYTVNVGKAREQIARGLYEEALPLLEEATAEAPDQAEGHFLLAVARLWTGRCDEACAGFRKAVELDPSLREGMSSQIRDRIVDRIRAGDLEGAKAAFAVALRYDPTLKSEVARSCIDKGENFLETGEDAIAQGMFRFVADVDPGTRTVICDLLYTKARAATGEESLKLVLASMNYGDRYQKEATRMLLRLANDLEDDLQRERYLAAASEYVESQSMLEASVDYYTRMWGPPTKVNLSSRDLWIGVDKPKYDDHVRYLTADRILTRAEGGAREMAVSVGRALDFTGEATASDKGYALKIWFSALDEPAVLYFWVVPTP
ncbi:MAG: tetratricopeptide repeat protein [bacterium]|nr:MAG: tetratricopeptide repeat protein [bacterium]